MDHEFSDSSSLILVVYHLGRLELSPLIRTHCFYAVASLGFYKGFVPFIGLERLTLLLLKVQLRFPGCVIDLGCNIEVPI